MQREEAVSKIRLLIGRDLVPLAEEYRVTIWKSPGKKNKGWAGHVIEHYLGLPQNSAQSPNFGSWELKVVPLKHSNKGLVVKETMAITMIDPYNVLQHPFKTSHLLAKLKKMVIAARVFTDVNETSSILHSVGNFDLSDTRTYEDVKQDYEYVRQVVRLKGFEALSGAIGELVQPRTKGPGHGNTSRAFYARAHFVTRMIGLNRMN